MMMMVMKKIVRRMLMSRLLTLLMSEPLVYCLKCKKRTENDPYSVEEVGCDNGALVRKSRCAICNARKRKFIGERSAEVCNPEYYVYVNNPELFFKELEERRKTATVQEYQYQRPTH